MTDLYETNLWGKIDYLHERYQREHTHISNFLDMITRFQNACSDFSKSISSILTKIIFYPKVTLQLYINPWKIFIRLF